MFTNVRFFFFFSILAYSQSAYSLMKESLDQGLKNPQREVTYEMIIERDGAKKERLFYFRTKRVESWTKSFIRFFQPSAIKGTSFLTHKYPNSTQQWTYLPAFKRIREISTAEKNGSFMGSDFSNSDIAGISLDEYNYSILKERSNDYIIKATPKEDESFYKFIIFYLEKERKAFSRIVFYDQWGKMFKYLTNFSWKKINGEWVSLYSEMQNKQRESKTTLKVLNFDNNVSLNETDFNISALSKL